MAAPDGHRGDADAAADEDGAGGFRVDLPGRGERVAEGAGDPDLLPCPQLAEAVGAGADALDKEVEAYAFFGRGGLGHRDRPRQERPPPLLAPTLGRGQHVELARLGRRALPIGQREDPVPARGPVAGDLAEAAAEGGPHRGCGTPATVPWISCSERTSASPCLIAAIARTAAVAPVIVVRQGIPCFTAAVRIS